MQETPRPEAWRRSTSLPAPAFDAMLANDDGEIRVVRTVGAGEIRVVRTVGAGEIRVVDGRYWQCQSDSGGDSNGTLMLAAVVVII